MMVTPVDLRRKLREPGSTASQPWCLSRPDSKAGEYSDTNDQAAGACFPCRSSARQRAHGRRIGTRHHASLEIARHSIPIAQCWCSGLVQGIFCPPSRRTTVRLLPERPAPRRRAKNAPADAVHRITRNLSVPETPNAFGQGSRGYEHRVNALGDVHTASAFMIWNVSPPCQRGRQLRRLAFRFLCCTAPV
jgi:hypothetical protein